MSPLPRRPELFVRRPHHRARWAACRGPNWLINVDALLCWVTQDTGLPVHKLRSLLAMGGDDDGEDNQGIDRHEGDHSASAAVAEVTTEPEPWCRGAAGCMPLTRVEQRSVWSLACSRASTPSTHEEAFPHGMPSLALWLIMS